MATTKAQSLPGGILKLTKLLDHLNKPPKLTLVKNVKTLRLTVAHQNDHWGARCGFLFFTKGRGSNESLFLSVHYEAFLSKILIMQRIAITNTQPFRHFIQEDLPRIRYANPDLEIQVVKWRKEKNEHWRPELELKFGAFVLAEKTTSHSNMIPPFSLFYSNHRTDDGRHQALDMHEKWSATILKELMSVAGGDPWKVHVAEAKRTGMPILPGEEIHEKAARAVTMKGGEKNEQLPNLREYLKANPQRAQREKTEGKTEQKNSGEGEVGKEVEAKVEQVIPEEDSTSKPPPATPSS